MADLSEILTKQIIESREDERFKKQMQLKRFETMLEAQKIKQSMEIQQQEAKRKQDEADFARSPFINQLPGAKNLLMGLGMGENTRTDIGLQTLSELLGLAKSQISTGNKIDPYDLANYRTGLKLLTESSDEGAKLTEIERGFKRYGELLDQVPAGELGLKGVASFVRGSVGIKGKANTAAKALADFRKGPLMNKMARFVSQQKGNMSEGDALREINGIAAVTQNKEQRALKMGEMFNIINDAKTTQNTKKQQAYQISPRLKSLGNINTNTGSSLDEQLQELQKQLSQEQE